MFRGSGGVGGWGLGCWLWSGVREKGRNSSKLDQLARDTEEGIDDSEWKSCGGPLLESFWSVRLCWLLVGVELS